MLSQNIVVCAYRHDECERVKKCGARVLTIDQLEGLKARVSPLLSDARRTHRPSGAHPPNERKAESLLLLTSSPCHVLVSPCRTRKFSVGRRKRRPTETPPGCGRKMGVLLALPSLVRLGTQVSTDSLSHQYVWPVWSSLSTASIEWLTATSMCLPVAERIGVNAEPECLVKEITPETECIVLASDGVFEFLSSQRVIDIVRFSIPATAVSLMVSHRETRCSAVSA
jgi:hypothetical protein